MGPGFYWARYKGWDGAEEEVVRVYETGRVGAVGWEHDTAVAEWEFGPRIPDYKPEEETEK